MRVAGCLFLAAASAVLPQSSQDLHNRFGESDLERFMVRPGISLTVEYASDHMACRLLIESHQALFHAEENSPPMSSEAVTEILEEVVPTHIRGKQTGRRITASGCNEFQTIDYENASITRSTHNCLPSKPEREIRATITFKRDICQPK